MRTYVLVVTVDSEPEDVFGPIEDVDAWVEQQVVESILQMDQIRDVSVYK